MDYITFLLVQCLKSNAATDLIPGIWNQASNTKTKSSMKYNKSTTTASSPDNSFTSKHFPFLLIEAPQAQCFDTKHRFLLKLCSHYILQFEPQDFRPGTIRDRRMQIETEFLPIKSADKRCWTFNSLYKESEPQESGLGYGNVVAARDLLGSKCHLKPRNDNKWFFAVLVAPTNETGAKSHLTSGIMTRGRVNEAFE
ncbi:hypothetical protein J6590_039717 [Homalodisca vitripennis]|nr:hypothetical protein J6590_039717 [Homalodisca vitripennis]